MVASSGARFVECEEGMVAEWESGIAVYPRCIRVAFGREDVLDFEREFRRELTEAEQVYQQNGEVWLGDVRLGSFPILTRKGDRLILVSRSGTSINCHSLEPGKEPHLDTAEITDILIDKFFRNFRATVWCWAEECIRKLRNLPRGRINVNWKQALFGQGLEREEWATPDTIHVWNLLRKCILTEIWWIYNRSLVEDTTRVTARYAVQQIWLSLRIYIILEWIQVIKAKERLTGENNGDDLASAFEQRWLRNGFAGMRTRNWVLWLWEEPLLISKLNY